MVYTSTLLKIISNFMCVHIFVKYFIRHIFEKIIIAKKYEDVSFSRVININKYK